MLTGHTARPDFLKKITWLAVNHHPSVMLIDTVRAFHFGNNFLVEVNVSVSFGWCVPLGNEITHVIAWNFNGHLKVFDYKLTTRITCLLYL